MATNFPTTLDDATSIPVESTTTPLATNHVTAHQNIQDALEAVEAKIGVNSSAVTTSHDYKLSGVTGSDKAMSLTGSETGTNKTFTSPVINVGSDATGDMYYRNAGVFTRIPVGTDNQILKLNSTTPNWEDETVTVDATDTTPGIVELATQAQVDNETATDGGNPLVVTPDKLHYNLFGGGDDGNVTISSNTTLTRDMYYNDLTVNSGIILTTANYRVFVKGTLTNNGTIRNNGNDGTAGGAGGDIAADGNGTAGTVGVSGAGVAAGTLPSIKAAIAATAGTVGQGGAAVTVAAGTAITYAPILQAAKTGGTGGNGGNFPSFGGAGGGQTGASTPSNLAKVQVIYLPEYFLTTEINTAGVATGGAGGGGAGAGGAAAKGGGGGGGGAGTHGGHVWIAAKKVINSATGVISANGGNGGNGGRGGNATVFATTYGGGGGGAGAGGDGGKVSIYYRSYSNAGSVTATGGTAGTAGAAGTGTTGNGDAGGASANGNSGVVQIIQI